MLHTYIICTPHTFHPPSPSTVQPTSWWHDPSVCGPSLCQWPPLGRSVEATLRPVPHDDAPSHEQDRWWVSAWKEHNNNYDDICLSLLFYHNYDLFTNFIATHFSSYVLINVLFSLSSIFPPPPLSLSAATAKIWEHLSTIRVKFTVQLLCRLLRLFAGSSSHLHTARLVVSAIISPPYQLDRENYLELLEILCQHQMTDEWVVAVISVAATGCCCCWR